MDLHYGNFEGISSGFYALITRNRGQNGTSYSSEETSGVGSGKKKKK